MSSAGAIFQGLKLLFRGGNIACPADVTLDDLAILALPNFSGQGVMVVEHGWSVNTSTANNKTIQLKLVNATVFTQTVTNTSNGILVRSVFLGRNQTAQQIHRHDSLLTQSSVFSSSGGFSSAGWESGVNLKFQAQKAVAGDTIVLEHYSVWGLA